MLGQTSAHKCKDDSGVGQCKCIGDKHLVIPEGCYANAIPFFQEHGEIDAELTGKYGISLAKTGVAGFLVGGCDDEVGWPQPTSQAFEDHIRTLRAGLNSQGYDETLILAAICARTAAEAIKLCTSALNSGASHALLLPPFQSRFNNGDGLVSFFREVSETSPISIVLCDAVERAGGHSADIEGLITLLEHSNIAGICLPSGDLDKLQRLKLRVCPNRVRIFVGTSLTYLPSLQLGGHGTISPMVNIAPKAHKKIWLSSKNNGTAAQTMQRILEQAETEAKELGMATVIRTIVREMSMLGSVEDTRFGSELEDLLTLEKSLDA
ncbi:aldolase [Neolentinus lepideus HHB14362 ss-1]|uniref:Aldolase n=1 Tax=Neolentinus lepideus HHB14362 ss-1 TaxID=1314782 RepID=A0A165S3D4_9AGAM|nr:aldolase [Neolentinus lepideus HHB14362 ss-1]